MFLINIVYKKEKLTIEIVQSSMSQYKTGQTKTSKQLERIIIMNKEVLKEFSKKCPYKVGESVPVVKYKLPYITIPLKRPKEVVRNQRITDIEIIQSMNTDKTTFVYKLGNGKKYYRLKRAVTEQGDLIHEKIKISLKKVKLWPYLPFYKECG